MDLVLGDAALTESSLTRAAVPLRWRSKTIPTSHPLLKPTRPPGTDSVVQSRWWRTCGTIPIAVQGGNAQRRFSGAGWGSIADKPLKIDE
jgi:hypothetical protein